VNVSRQIRSIRTSLWFVPVVCVVVGVVISTATLAADRAGGYDLVPRQWTGGPDVAIAVLSRSEMSSGDRALAKDWLERMTFDQTGRLR
jgi:hypothetical protein